MDIEAYLKAVAEKIRIKTAKYIQEPLEANLAASRIDKYRMEIDS